MKKRILSCLMALALCLTLLPTAALAEETEGTAQTPPAVEESADPANGEAKQENQSAAPEEEKQPAEQEEQQEDSAAKQDEAVAAVQAMIDALPDAAALDGMDDEARESAYLAASEAYDAYDALREEQQSALTGAEKMIAILKWSNEQVALATEANQAAHEHCLCGVAECDQKGHEQEEGMTTFEPWNGSTSGTFYLNSDLVLTNTLTVPSGSRLTLCLNGYDIVMKEAGDAIKVGENATFTLCDCKRGGAVNYYGAIRHTDSQQFNGRGVTVEAGTFYMYGGKISNNTVGSNDGSRGIGGGVVVSNKGIFNMIGGEITGNTAMTGGGVDVGAAHGTYGDSDKLLGGTFSMTGGKIYGNKCVSRGGGVYVNSTKTNFTVSGSAQITDNYYTGTYSDGSTQNANNVYLGKYTNDKTNETTTATINVEGTLDSSASIGVTVPTSDKGAFTSQLVARGVSAAAEKCFTSDSSKYRLIYNSGVGTLTMIAAAHSKHPICGKTCTHDGEHSENLTWTPLTYNNEKLCYGTTEVAKDSIGYYALPAGDYYLTADIEIKGTITTTGKVNLCLNGYRIIETGDVDAIKVNSNTFTLCDCVGTGKITHAEGKTGCGVYVINGTFIMHGGSITGNRNTQGDSYGYGGGVNMDGGSFTMTGGSITKNSVTSNKESYGGGVCVGYKSRFTMTGGSITENKTGSYGGGVYVDSSSTAFTVSGEVNITGNTHGNIVNNVELYPLTGGNLPTITIGEGGLDASAKIGVTAKNVGTGEYVTVATGASNGYTEGTIISDRTGDYVIKRSGNNINLYNGLPHEHAICGKTAENCTDSSKHDDVVWKPLTSDTNGTPSVGSTALGTGKFNTTVGYVLPAGHYYLSTELTLDKPLLIKKGVSLCLNGKTLTVSSNNSAVIIDTGCDLTLCDCSEEQPGKITHAANATGRGVYMGASQGRDDSYNGSFTMYGGSITGNHIAANSGAGVYMRYGTFNMHGGSITGNTTAENHGTGGVYVSGGEFNMTGGRITDTGGGVRVDSQGTFNMSGNAVISNNNAYYGGVYVYAATFNMSGNASVSGNTASYGGGVYVGAGTASAAAKFNMSGNASISGNIANYGGGVYVYGSSSFTMSEKAAITGNNVNNDGGVYVNGYTATMTVSGDVQIKDNWQDGSKNDKTGVYEKGDDSSANNFYLFGEDETKQQTITIGGVLETTARIGVTTCLTPTASNPIKIATGATGDLDYAKIFTPDVTDYTVTKDGTTLYLSAHQHSWSYTLSEDKTTITAKCNDTSCTAPNGGSVTINKPAHTTYGDGQSEKATLKENNWQGLAVNEIIITYKKGNDTLEAAPTDAGTYTASITLTGADGKTATASVEYTINQAYLEPPVLSNVTAVYGNTLADVKLTDGWTWENETQSVGDVGVNTFKATYTPNDHNYKVVHNIDVTVTVNRAPVTISITGMPAGPITYGDTFTLTATAKNGETPLTGGTWTWDYDQGYFKLAESNANTDTLKLQAIKAGAPSKNVTATYESGTHKGSATMNPSVAQKEVAVTAGSYKVSKTYDGTTNVGTASGTLNVTGILPADSGVTVKVTPIAYTSADVGGQSSMNVSIALDGTGKDNYKIKDDATTVFVPCEITAKALTISGATAISRDYVQNDKSVGISGVTFTGASLAKNADYTVTGEMDNANAGTDKNVNVTVTLTGSAAANYTLNSNTTTTKVTIHQIDPTTPTGLTGLKDQALSTVNLPDGWTWDAPSTTMSTLGKQIFMASYAVSTNYKAKANVKVTVTVSDKDTVTISGLTAALELTYNGFVQTGYTGTPSYSPAWSGIPVATYYLNDGTTKTTTANSGAVGEGQAPKNAGNYKVTIAIPDSDPTYIGHVTLDFAIAKRTISVKADNKSMTANGTLPTFTVTYGNFASGDSEATVIETKATAFCTADGTSTGSFPITVSGTTALKSGMDTNYEVGTPESGTLTVSTRPSGGGGGSSSGGGSSGGGGGSSRPTTHPVKAEVSKDPDGSVSLSKTSAAKGDKVTITVKPEQHYEVDEVIVRDSKGKRLAVKDNGDGTFTFEMPADKVTVEPTFSWVNPFADVADSAYYVDAVEWMLKRELTQGTTETTFGPDLNCTRAQIVTFLWRAAGSPAPKGTVSFADVSTGSYYAKAVAWAIENGITGGTGDGLFSPDATCTRAQSAAFLYRAAGSPAVNGSAGFSDVAADAYYAQAVAWAKEHGITDGIGGGLFGSANDCTRAQIAAFLYRYMK